MDNNQNTETVDVSEAGGGGAVWDPYKNGRTTQGIYYEDDGDDDDCTGITAAVLHYIVGKCGWLNCGVDNVEKRKEKKRKGISSWWIKGK